MNPPLAPRANDEEVGARGLVEQHLRAAALDRLGAHVDAGRRSRGLLAGRLADAPAIVCEASNEASTPTSLGVYQGEG